MMISRDMVYDMLSKSVKTTEDKLLKLSKDSNAHLVVNSGFIKRAEGMFGFISCFPHGDNSEESLDGTLIVSGDIDSIITLVEVSWSSGEFVEEIGKATFLIDGDDAQLDIWKIIEIKLFDVMSQTLFN